MMEDFVETVRDRHSRELLEIALRGQGAFRRFKSDFDHRSHRFHG